MSIDLILKVAGIGLLVGICAIILNEAGKKEQAQMVTIAGVVVVLYLVIQGISDLFVLVKSVFNLY
ncbi:MAG: stage III sporulation protein AC [Dehalobacter sp. 4CP]|jgi:stage III sporulation protein AC|uniref:Stage III sporulation protein AC n=2 Tax=Dehalobacter restrictus TaxID=55583 RepID=A0A857DIP7_9FIRM|nr:MULTISPECIES: stage III sporulation protein AC [Dehalobacter]NBJ14986.1 stage III sporulation protein AC [Dehalobacter sp. 4CP]AFV01470.1 Stage III sporulation protein AC [Dehalobacter sp. DCA]AFV04507.1 Stage III sporulation protein AC [Dehalobacter sp. CF]AHF09784.1 stage III sporulation protein AC [Dehalobacter restrictus DSM 9455]EQB20579.1 Stage III sporulation protein AC [Dehalobacter sp. UNSWDHB]